MNPSSGTSGDEAGTDGGGGAAFAIAHTAPSNSQLLPDLN
jgi:hypothetical protein